MKILNCTPHEICIFEDAVYISEHRKYFIEPEKTKLVTIIPPSGILLNVHHETEFLPSILYECPVNGEVMIPVITQRIQDIDPIPDDADIIIVSNQYASAAVALNLPNVDKLYTIAHPVYERTSSGSIRPIGCLGLRKVKP